MLKPCPFCGDEPEFMFLDWDDTWYFSHGELYCCVKMTEEIPFMEASKLSRKERKEALKSLLTTQWNTRYNE